MKRFLIHVSTYWCGMDNTFRAEAESELELYEIAEQLAYDNFQSYGCEDDIAIEGTCMLVRRMYEKCKVFIVTGREGTPEIIAATKKWLAKHDVVVDELFFRPVKDYSPGADCKKKIYEDNIKGKYNVQFVLEDNYKCVKMWREQGLVCLQPNEGKF